MIEYIVIFQLVTIIANIIFCKKNEIEKIKYYISSLSLICAIIACVIFILQISNPVSSYKHLYNFIIIEKFCCSIGLLSDSLSITISSIACIIAALVNFYSIGYIHRNISLFLLYINLFSLFSVLFISSNNLLQMYICLAILSVVLYFLIIFDDKQKSAICGFKIMLLYRFGDIAFIISTIAIFTIFGSLNFDDINKFSIQNDVQMDLIEVTAIMMFVSIFIKSLPVGFTSSITYISRLQIPASAIVNSSIFLFFGVFIMIRLQSFFEFSDFVQNIIIILGVVSAIYCALKSVFSRNLDKILLFSTYSQVGLVMVACGFSSYGSAIMLFVNHAFSKALFFFSSGSVIRALSGEKHIDKMGGLFDLLPKTYIGFIMSALSMLCLPLLPYYYAQKILLNDVINSELSSYYIGVVAIIITFFLTNIYIFRMIYFIFFGKNKTEEKTLAYLNENEPYIINVIYLSVLFAIFSGIIFFYIIYTNIIWKDVFAFSFSSNTNITLISFIINLCGILIALVICKSIKSRELFLSLSFNYYNNVHRINSIICHFLSSVRATIANYIFQFKEIININYDYYLENKIKPGASFICFMLIVLLCVTLWNI